MEDTKLQPLFVRMYVDIDRATHDRMKVMAAQMRMTNKQLVAKAINAYCDANTQPENPATKRGKKRNG